MLVDTLPLTAPLTLHAAPLTREAFAPFGDVVTNPRPACLPSNTDPASVSSTLPCGAISANQGTAIQYKKLAAMRDHYAEAASGRRASARMTMFVCGSRELKTFAIADGGQREAKGVEVTVLERHPFTSQTFIPLTADGRKRYLVIVAPSLPPGERDAKLPVPASTSAEDGTRLPGRGLPDLRGMRAFLAEGHQAVTYGAGTWHAPMMALGPRGEAIDFVVVQFANDEAIEDCQEVELKGQGSESKVKIALPDGSGRIPSKL
ncbi:putative ureidoglycolate hydrolase [Xylariaceae sp. FL0016]|nr:putative ureidoglycolate hydrolase [Xylariaceae sp. FL0016]